MNKKEQVMANYDSAIADIRRDPGRTLEWKQQRMAYEYVRAKELVKQIDEAARAADRSRMRTLSERVYGTGGLNGDTASLVISRRDAGDRAAQLKNQDDALDLLARAERSGDEPLARAIVERAIESRWDKAVNTFLETRPHLDAPVTELWEYRQPTANETLGRLFASHVQRPTELSGVNDWQINQLAAADAPASA